jgi:hypothetical protein
MFLLLDQPIQVVLRIRIRDPVPPGSRMGKNQDSDPGSGSGMNIPDQIFESLETIFGVKKILKFFDADVDADLGSENIFDPGSGIRDGKNSGPGSWRNIPNPQDRKTSFR